MFLKKFHNIIILILGLVLLFIKPDFQSILDPVLLATYSLIFISALIIYFIKYSKSSVKINWFRIDVFFLIGFFIVHFQWPVMYGLSGLVPEFASRVWVDERYVNYGTWMSTLGGLAWILGFSFKKFRPTNNKFNFDIKYHKLLNFTIIIFILFLITAGKDFLTGGVYKGSGGSSAGEGISAYIQLLYSTSIILLTTLIIIDKKDKFNGNVLKWFLKLDIKFLILFFTYIILFFLIGDRGGPVFLLLTTSILIGSIIKPIKLRTLVISVFLGGIFLTLISLGRSETSGFGIFSAGLEKFEFSSGYDNTIELANSVRTLYRAISVVPQEHDYFYGKLWSADILSLIPFGQSFFLNLTNVSPYEMSSSGYITFLTFGENATSGEGTSLIADIYLNFGLSGICFFMFFLGMFFRRVDVELQIFNNFKWIIIAAIVASMSISLSRNGIFLMARPIFWSFIILFLFVKRRKVRL